MRKIACMGCGPMTEPTPPEDAALGLFERRVYGRSALSLMCDYCSKRLSQGDEVIALSVPLDMPEWESRYLLPALEGK